MKLDSASSQPEARAVACALASVPAGAESPSILGPEFPYIERSNFEGLSLLDGPYTFRRGPQRNFSVGSPGGVVTWPTRSTGNVKTEGRITVQDPVQDRCVPILCTMIVGRKNLEQHLAEIELAEMQNRTVPRSV